MRPPRAAARVGGTTLAVRGDPDHGIGDLEHLRPPDRHRGAGATIRRRPFPAHRRDDQRAQLIRESSESSCAGSWSGRCSTSRPSPHGDRRSPLLRCSRELDADRRAHDRLLSASASAAAKIVQSGSARASAELQPSVAHATAASSVSDDDDERSMPRLHAGDIPIHRSVLVRRETALRPSSRSTTHTRWSDATIFTLGDGSTYLRKQQSRWAGFADQPIRFSGVEHHSEDRGADHPTTITPTASASSSNLTTRRRPVAPVHLAPSNISMRHRLAVPARVRIQPPRARARTSERDIERRDAQRDAEREEQNT